MRFLFALPLIFVLSLPAAAQDATSAVAPDADELRRAQQLFQQGVRRAQQERWADALELFRQSRDLVDRPGTVFNMAVCMHRLGRFHEALDAVDEFLRLSDPEADAADRATAAALRPELLAALVTLRLTLSPANASIEIDGEPVPGEGERREIVLDPGRHVIHVVADGHRAERVRISALGGDEVDREITLASLTPAAVPATTPAPVAATAPAPPSDESPDQGILGEWWFWTAVGVVVAGVATGVVLLSSSGGDGGEPVPGDDGVLVFTLERL